MARMFADNGAIIVDADKVARDVVQPGAPGSAELRELLGSSFFDSEGQLIRPKLRDCIINDSRCRSRVNAILHPHICSAMEDEWERRQATDPGIPVIFDIPLLFEANLADRFDTVILVYVPVEKQIERLMERDGLIRSDAERTLAMQLPIESKKSLAHIVIDNSRDLAHTRKQVDSIWKELRA